MQYRESRCILRTSRCNGSERGAEKEKTKRERKKRGALKRLGGQQSRWSECGFDADMRRERARGEERNGCLKERKDKALVISLLSPLFVLSFRYVSFLFIDREYRTKRIEDNRPSSIENFPTKTGRRNRLRSPETFSFYKRSFAIASSFNGTRLASLWPFERTCSYRQCTTLLSSRFFFSLSSLIKE